MSSPAITKVKNEPGVWDKAVSSRIAAWEEE
jgi:hypothetical protein